MRTIRLRPGMHYAPVDGGVYFSSARATFVLRGPAVLFRLIDTCLPLLEDGTDIDELVTAIGSPAARTLIARVVDTLDAKGLVLHLDQLQVPEPSPAERECFPEALAYLETYQDNPYADFRRIRKSRVLLAGPVDALGPAVRGLVRAGVGQVLVATPEPDRLAGLASRHPEVRLLLYEEGGIATLVAGSLPDAAVVFTEDGFPVDAIQRLPTACLAIPVRLGKDVAIVGPAVARADSLRAAERLWCRAATWCRRDGDDLLVRPSGDLLAGALAGQVTIDAMIGLNPGRVHMVHGPDLSSDSIAPTLCTDVEYSPPTELGAGPPTELGAGPSTELGAGPSASAPPASTDSLGWLDSASGRWAGLFRITVPGDLPQMPLTLTLADGRSNCFDGRAIGFGPDQEASTTEAGLEALRRHCAALERHRRQVEPRPVAGEPAVTGAGLDKTRWLLDGALRLLAAAPGEERAVDWLGIDDADARRMWRTLEEHELTPVRLTRRHVPEFGWTLVSVHDRQGGSLLSGGWGPTPAIAAVAALSAAIATQQVRRTVHPGYEAGAPGPGFHHQLHGQHVGNLATAVNTWLAATGRRLRGQRVRRDPVTGTLGAWCGPVWLDD